MAPSAVETMDFNQTESQKEIQSPNDSDSGLDTNSIGIYQNKTFKLIFVVQIMKNNFTMLKWPKVGVPQRPIKSALLY